MTIKKILSIGLTGGISSGKTTVANMFSELGITIIDADVIAHQITKPHTEPFNKIVQHFGKEILSADKRLNRSKLRHIIFNDPNERRWLEQLLHPIIITEMKNQITSAQSPYCILVIPLLIEAIQKNSQQIVHQINFIDRICVVDIPQKLQISRARLRDNTTDVDINAILKSQTKREEKLALADDIIVNDSDLESLRERVNQLHQYYIDLAKRNNE